MSAGKLVGRTGRTRAARVEIVPIRNADGMPIAFDLRLV